MKAFISTPFGDFDYVKSDFSRGSSCRQCCLHGEGICNDVCCDMFDTDDVHFHFQRHYEIGGAS